MNILPSVVCLAWAFAVAAVPSAAVAFWGFLLVAAIVIATEASRRGN